ncbi:MAG: radical SAM protein [Oscillospiraceae bacterium]|jgi:MoaA/NifB/PqqE/SkfB family radical SAM enzyme|nr:radical SAM protein [Oscillospiraceae bacterium]
MTILDKTERAALDLALRPLLHYVGKNPGPNAGKLVGLVDVLSGHSFPRKTMEAFRTGAQDRSNNWTQFAARALNEIDRGMLRRLLLSLGLGIAKGTQLVRKNREKYQCNIPFQILFDPTSACNLHCKGCWAGEYEHKNSLSFDEMDAIVTQGAALGTRVYMLTGGEPLIRKDDILALAQKHRNCTFLAYTNATLIDQALCRATKALGNVVFAISLEGFEESNDARRGKGAYAKSMEAIEMLRRERCLFGVSVCYTSENIDAVTSDEFVDGLIAKGAMFGFYFHYMPLGKHAAPELLPTAAQREHVYRWMRQIRSAHGGKPIFLMDFQNDGEYVGGCIAGGRNYFHINAAGDMEPCVFIHYSDSNIRQHTLLEALKRPLFQAYYHGQPFNDNHLRPCPMLENPDYLRRMVAATGAVSTDLMAPEDVNDLCAKCDRYAADWAGAAERIWREKERAKPKTQYYRDRAEK